MCPPSFDISKRVYIISDIYIPVTVRSLIRGVPQMNDYKPISIFDIKFTKDFFAKIIMRF